MRHVNTKEDVELILETTSEIANERISSGLLPYIDGASNEIELFSIIREACAINGFSDSSLELISGHKFPDVIFRNAQIGIEIKGHKNGDRILGNSIMGSTPSLNNPVAIYLLAWNDSEKTVIWRDYFQCVIGAEVTHSPRFVLKPKCEVEESLFGTGEHQIGEAQDICLGENGFKSDVILARMRARALAEGNIPWWINPQTDDEMYAADQAQQELSIVKYSALDANAARKSFLKTLLIGFPELFSRSQTKYDAALVWGLVRKSVLISRDAFTAGGKIETSIPSICSLAPLKLPKIFDRAKSLFDSNAIVSRHDLEDIWQERTPTKRKMLLALRNRITESGISEYRDLVLHHNCVCSRITNEQFAQKMTEWLLEDFDPSSIR